MQTTTLKCDGTRCKATYTIAGHEWATNQQAREDGWLVRGEFIVEHYCPKCRKNVEASS